VCHKSQESREKRVSQRHRWSLRHYPFVMRQKRHASQWIKIRTFFWLLWYLLLFQIKHKLSPD